ncbi:MAG: recombinase family protein, partial [Shimia sp.]
MIAPTESKIVWRIFEDYAADIYPKKIAAAFYEERAPGSTGRCWGASTLHDNRESGTGILSNRLYFGRQVWYRLQYVKDPDTGKRHARLHLPDDWVNSVGKANYGCANTRNKGTCSNRLTIKRTDLEDRVLCGLKDQLLHSDLIAEFVKSYQEEHNRLTA